MNLINKNSDNPIYSSENSEKNNLENIYKNNYFRKNLYYTEEKNFEYNENELNELLRNKRIRENDFISEKTIRENLNTDSSNTLKNHIDNSYNFNYNINNKNYEANVDKTNSSQKNCMNINNCQIENDIKYESDFSEEKTYLIEKAVVKKNIFNLKKKNIVNYDKFNIEQLEKLIENYNENINTDSKYSNIPSIIYENDLNFKNKIGIENKTDSLKNSLTSLENILINKKIKIEISNENNLQPQDIEDMSTRSPIFDIFNTNFEKLNENNKKNFLENKTWKNHDFKEKNDEIFKFDTLNNLYNQLNNLETILLNTKKQLFGLDTFFFNTNTKNIPKIQNVKKNNNLKTNPSILSKTSTSKQDLEFSNKINGNLLYKTRENQNFEVLKIENLIKNSNASSHIISKIKIDDKNNFQFQDDIETISFINNTSNYKFQNNQNNNIENNSNSNIMNNIFNNNNVLFQNLDNNLNEDQSFQFFDNVFQI